MPPSDFNSCNFESCPFENKLKTMEAGIGRLEEKLDKALESVNGNGKPGLKERIARMEVGQKIGATVGSVLLVAVVGLIFKILSQ